MWYPHRRVRLLIRAKAIDKVARQLKVPADFGAVLPLGPPGKPKEVPEATVNQTKGSEGRCKDCGGLITNIEEELCCVEGLGEKEAALRSGRSKGVVYCWENPLGGVTADNSRTTSVSRAWRQSTIWLRGFKKTVDTRVPGAAT